MRYPARAQPAAVPFNDFPPWTRDDERRLENLQSRGRRIRRKKPSDLTVRTLPIEAVHSDRRRDLLEYTVDAAGGAYIQASDEAPSSDESGDNSDSPAAPNSPRPSVDHPGSSLPPPLMPLDPLRPPVMPLPTRSNPALDPQRLPSSGNAEDRTPKFTPIPKPTPVVDIITTTTAPKATTVTTSAPMISLTPIATGPIPFLPSNARKGLVSPSADRPFAIQTDDVPVSTTSFSTFETAGPERIAEDPRPRGDLHASTEKALVAVGSVGATIIVFFVFWLGWKFFKLRRQQRPGISYWRSQRPSLETPKHALVSLASRVPILREQMAKRRWSNLEKPYDRAYWEGSSSPSRSTRNEASHITVHTAITRSSESSNAKGGSGLTGHAPNQSMSSTRPQLNDTLRSDYQVPNNIRMSDISSLSSGFGDGDIIMPSPKNIAALSATQLQEPMPAATRSSVGGVSHRRETICTEASEDPVPRFRNINSWVRQQTGRVKRAKQWDSAASDVPPLPTMPPEQDFRLMMPDGEEPRRVETTTPNGNMPEDGSPV